MPYALILKWFLGGGWLRCLEALAVVVAIVWATVWLHNYHTMQDKAAKTDQLQGQITDEHQRLAAVKDKLTQAEADRDAARKALTMNDADRAAYFAEMARRYPNAPIRTNPLCLPTDADRGMRNDARQKFVPGFGIAGAGGAVPAIPK